MPSSKVSAESAAGASQPRSRTHQALLDAIECVCRTDGRPTIAAVAREAGVSAALIHNRYTDVASTIRALAGKHKRDDVAALRAALEIERGKCKSLRTENAELLCEIRTLASVNETLRRQAAIDQAKGTVRRRT